MRSVISATMLAALVSLSVTANAKQNALPAGGATIAQVDGCESLIVSQIGDSTAPISCLDGLTARELKHLVSTEQADRASVRAELKATSERLGLTEGLLQAVLSPLGIGHVPEDQLPAKVAEAIGLITELKARVRPGSTDSVEVAGLKARARSAILAGDLGEADGALARVQALDEAAPGARLAEIGSTAAQRGALAITQLRYRDGAGFYANAARFAQDDEERIRFLEQEASAWYKQGREMGDNEALRAAIARYTTLLEYHPRERDPMQWATTQNRLGAALDALGSNESGVENLNKAVAAYNQALLVWTRSSAPVYWAKAQNNLGTALGALGLRESGTEGLTKAAAAYRAALLEWHRDQVPLYWASAEKNLGGALTDLGRRQSGGDSFDKAVEAYDAALLERPRDRFPLQWASIQGGRALALEGLYEQRGNVDDLADAVAATKLALEETPRGQAPLGWANLQNQLGLMLVTLGSTENDVETLSKAVDALNAAQLEITRERVPLAWAQTEGNLGNALEALGQLEDGTEILSKAAAAYQAALLEMTRERAPLWWGQVNMDLAYTDALLALRLKDRTWLTRAEEHYHNGLPYYGNQSPGTTLRQQVEDKFAEVRIMIGER